MHCNTVSLFILIGQPGPKRDRAKQIFTMYIDYRILWCAFLVQSFTERSAVDPDYIYLIIEIYINTYTPTH